MRVFNADKTQVLEDYDLSLGRLEPDVIITHHDAVIVHHQEVVVHHDAVVRHHDAVVVHHDAVQHVEEQGHYEVVALYPNGGKDVRWVVDVEGVVGHDAYDEIVSEAYDEMVSPSYDETVSDAYDEVVVAEHDDVEDIALYIPYTPMEILENELDENLGWLEEHDYIGVKIATGRATVDEYATEIAEMAVRADRVNQLKAEIEALRQGGEA